MQNRRDWLRSSLGIGGLLLAPSNLLTAQEKTDFNPRPLEPVIRLSSNENLRKINVFVVRMKKVNPMV